jgi:hypothetical protein
VPVRGHESKILAQKKWAGFHQAHGDKKNELVASSPWRKEKRADCIQPTEKRKMGWLYPAHGEKEKWVGCIQPMELQTIKKRKMDWFQEKKKEKQKYRRY